MQILIVDDIPVIRAAIITAIESNYTQFTFFEAGDGEEAFLITQHNEIDLMITDIKMPHCDGLELIGRLRKEGFEKPIAILSGFGEFEYAKKALNLGISAYLLKPIDKEQLFQVVDKAVSQITRSQSLQYIKAENKLLEKENYQIKVKNALQNAIFLSSPLVGINELENQYFCLAVIRIEQENELLHYGMTNITQYLELGVLFHLLEHPIDKKQYILLFFSDSGAHLPNQTYIAIQKISFELKATLNIEMAVGISEVSSRIPNLYRQAFTAMKQVIQCGGKIAAYHPVTGKPAFLSVQDIHILDQYIAQGQLDNLKELLNSRMQDLQVKAGDTAMSDIVNEIIPIIVQSLIQNFGYHVFAVSETLAMSYGELSTLENIQVLTDKIIAEISGFFTEAGMDASQEEKTVLKVKEYIDNHYYEDISVKKLAKQFNINYSYLSSLFAKEVGVGIAVYGTNIRMEMAKSLLLSTTSGIAVIAEMVGYDDLQYFYRVFKKYTGKPPISYRNHTKKIQ